MEKIKTLLKNKAVVTSLVALGVAVAASFGYQVSPEINHAIQVIIMAFAGL